MSVWGRRHPTDEELSLLLDGRLSDKDRRRVEEHLKACDECRAAFEDLQRTVALLRQAPRPVPPRAFTLSEADIQATRFRSPRFGWARPLLPWATVFVGFLLVAVVGLQAFLLLSGFSATPPGEHEYALYFSTQEIVVSPPLTPDMKGARVREEARGEKSGMVTPRITMTSRALHTPMLAIARVSTPRTPEITLEETTVAMVERPSPPARVMMPVERVSESPQPHPTSRPFSSLWILLLDVGLFLLFIGLVILWIRSRKRV